MRKTAESEHSNPPPYISCYYYYLVAGKEQVRFWDSSSWYRQLQQQQYSIDVINNGNDNGDGVGRNNPLHSFPNEGNNKNRDGRTCTAAAGGRWRCHYTATEQKRRASIIAVQYHYHQLPQQRQWQENGGQILAQVRQASGKTNITNGTVAAAAAAAHSQPSFSWRCMDLLIY